MEEKDLHYFITRIINPDLNWIVVSLRSSRRVVHGRDGYTGLRWTDHTIADSLATKLEEWRDNLWYKYKRDFPANGKAILDEFFEILVEIEAKLSDDPNKERVLRGLWELAESMGEYLGMGEYVSQKAKEVKERATEIRERDRYLRKRVEEVKTSKSKTRIHPSRYSKSPLRETAKVKKNGHSRRVHTKHFSKKRKRRVLKTAVWWIVTILVLSVGVAWISTGTPSGITQVARDLFSEGQGLLEPHETYYNYSARPINRTFSYCLRGQTGAIRLTLYGGVVEHMESILRTVYSDQLDEYWDIMVDRLIDDKVQDEYLTPLVEKIKSITDDPDDQLRIAVSLVQMIPYDWDAYSSVSDYMKSPYEVLYYNKGVCSEKSFLLAYLLKKLGFGVILLDYEAENHMAVAVRCPLQYANFQYGDEGYCFIETTRPTIITYIPDNYIGVGELKSTPHMIFVSDGREFTGVVEEYRDAREYERLEELARRNNNVLPEAEYSKWWHLASKYCLLDDGSEG